MSNKTVFISYAREDTRHAERLYMDLRYAEIDAWLDTKRLLPGQNWRREIRQIINNAEYFIALISKYSLNKRGFVQSEIKQALETLSEIPLNKIFLIPVRLDDSEPEDESLKNLSWVNLHHNYEQGLERILATISDISKKPLEYSNLVLHSESKNIPVFSEGKAPIRYTPYRKFSDFVQDIIEKLPKASYLADSDYSMYVKFHTTVLGVKLPQYLIEKYPTEIIIVLQHQFEKLTALKDSFSVILWFNGKPETLIVPYDAIQEIIIPTIGLRLEYFG